MENLFTPFSHTLQYALGWMVVHSLWQAVTIALVTGVLMLILRKKSAKLRYFVGNVALLLVLVSAFATFTYYYQSEKQAQNAVLNGLTQTQNQSAALTPVIGKNDILTVDKMPDPQNAGKDLVVIVAKPSESDATSGVTVFKDYFNKNIPLIVTIWVIGMALFLLKLLSGISYTYVVRNRHNFPVDEYWLEKLDTLKMKLGIQKAIDVVESALVRSPVVVGHLKPMILFPIGVINRLSPQDVEAILAHELAHIARHDYVFNILQSLVEALFYYHPAVWWLSAQVRNERESACDEIAIQLTGDSIHYARTLVTVQEMAFFPLSNAMAFAGQPKKSQFLLRIQRILNQKQNNNVMEKFIATFLIIGSLVVITIAQNQQKNTQSNISISEDSFLQWGNAPLSNSGFWHAKMDGEEVKVTFNHDVDNGNWTTTRRFKKSEFSALPTTDSEFTLLREAGTMKFKGKFEGEEGYGKFKFEESADFKTYLASQGIENVKEEMMVHLFMANINKGYLAFLKQNGYDRITKSNLQDMAIHGLSRERLDEYMAMFNQPGWKKPSLERLIEFKIHGVSAEYLKSLNDLGYKNLNEEDVLQAKIHGVKADYIKGLKDAGYTDLSMEKLVEMKIHGVSGEYAQKVNGSRKEKMSTDELVDYKIHGVDKIDVEKLKKAGVEPSNEDLKSFAIHRIDAEYIEKMNNAGFGKLDAEKLLAAKIHGVKPETAKEFGDMGYKNLSFDKVLEFKIHGITPEYARNIAAAGYKDLSANKIVEFKIHGITPEYVKSVSDMGFKDLPASKIVEMKIHGVSADFIKGFTDAGYKDTPLSKIIEMKIHGVTPVFIKGFNDMGFKDIALSKAVEMKIHGISPDYIKRMQEKGYKNLDLDEYVRLKIHGFGNSSGGARSMGNININPNIHVNPNIHIDPIHLDPLNIHIDPIDVKIDADAIEKEVSKAVSNIPMGWFLKNLIRDGRISLNKKVRVKGTRNSLSIDGQKLDNSVFQTYLKQVEAKEGKTLDEDFDFLFDGVITDLKGETLSLKGKINSN